MKTLETLAVLAAISGLITRHKFRPLTANDAAAFSGAADDARIAFGDDVVAGVLCGITGESISTEGGEAVAVIISGDTVELHATSIDGNPVCVTLNLTVGC